MEFIRSPIKYMGNKYRLLKEFKKAFPNNIENFIDLFGGSGTVSLNVNAELIVYNELNNNIYNLFKMFKEKEYKTIVEYIEERINKYNLPTSEEELVESSKKRFNEFRKAFNTNQSKEYLDLLTLHYFSINNLIRFNKNNRFNAPAGCYTPKAHRFFKHSNKLEIKSACDIIKQKNVIFENEDFEVLLKKLIIEFELGKDNEENTFIYCDPPYLNTTAIYNENRLTGWTIENDYKLFEWLEALDDMGYKWALSNVFENKGKTNNHLIEWCNKNKWYVEHFNISYNVYNSASDDFTDEVFISNYEIPVKQMKLF